VNSNKSILSGRLKEISLASSLPLVVSTIATEFDTKYNPCRPRCNTDVEDEELKGLYNN